VPNGKKRDNYQYHPEAKFPDDTWQASAAAAAANRRAALPVQPAAFPTQEEMRRAIKAGRSIPRTAARGLESTKGLDFIPDSYFDPPHYATHGAEPDILKPLRPCFETNQSSMAGAPVFPSMGGYPSPSPYGGPVFPSTGGYPPPPPYGGPVFPSTGGYAPPYGAATWSTPPPATAVNSYPVPPYRYPAPPPGRPAAAPYPTLPGSTNARPAQSGRR
jgi:hypothetical protein